MEGDSQHSREKHFSILPKLLLYKNECQMQTEEIFFRFWLIFHIYKHLFFKEEEGFCQDDMK